MFEGIIRQGVLMTVIVLIISILGILAALRIPVQMIPDLEVRTISIRTTWPGATPQDIEKEILIEQEEYLRTVPNLERLTAEASNGRAEIELEFPFGVDITETLIEVNNALNQVPSYPINVDEPRILATSFSANAFMYFRVSPLPGNPRQLDMDLMRDFIEDNVRTRMERIDGVSEVRVGGGAERQIQILLNPERLAERNLTVLDIRQAINARNRDVSGGELERGKRRYLLRTVGRAETLDDLRQLIVARHGDAIIRLGELADIRLDHFEISDESYVNGQPVLSLSVRRETGSNVISIKRAMMPEVDAINEQLLRPAGMEMQLTSDDVRYVEASVANVWQNLAIGALLATLVMYLFLRSVKATAIGVIGIPICTIAAFLGLLVAGRTINVISLAGVAFAIGMTLDNSIVVLESIVSERRNGLDRFRAAVAGVQRVWPAVLASTMTTVLVFLPVLFIQEEAGQLFSDIAIAVSASILMSMLVAITLIPTASARLSFQSTREPSPRAVKLREAALAGTVWLIATAPRRVATMALALLATALIILLLTPAAEYLPEGEEPKTFATMNAPPGYNLSEMSRIARELQDYFLPHVDEDPARFDGGESQVPALAYLNMSVEPQEIRIIAEPLNPAHMNALMAVLDTKYREYPGMRPFVTRGSIISSNDGGTRSINLDISGPRLDGIYAVALAAYRRAEEIFQEPNIQTEPSTLSLAQPLVELRPNWERAAELGLTAEDLGYTVAALTDGAFVDEFFLEDDKIDIYAYSQAGVNARLDTLAHLPILTPQGTTLPLGSLVTITQTVDTSTVRRVNGRRTVTLNIIPPRTVPLETGVERVEEQLMQTLRQQGLIPPDVTIDISGASDQLQAAKEALWSNYLVALLIIYLLMVAIFSHWGYPLLIMTTIPLGVAGGIVGLWLLNGVGGWLPALGLNAVHQPFDMISMLGFLILMGTVVNNPILVVHRTLENLKENGANLLDAAHDAVRSRLRPIIMTTITTVCGLAPLVFMPGEGTELYRGLGAIVLFGLMSSTLVTLTVLPALTVTLLQRKAASVARD